MGHPVFQTPGLAPGVLLNGFDQLDIGEELDTLKRQEKSGRTLEGKLLYSVRASDSPRHLSHG